MSRLSEEDFKSRRKIVLYALNGVDDEQDGWAEAANILASALNEHLIKCRYCATIRLLPLVSAENDDKR